MTDRDQSGITPRDRLVEAARKELVDFEPRENEFRKKDRDERAAECGLPAILARALPSPPSRHSSVPRPQPT